jgi:hypothetical protein
LKQSVTKAECVFAGAVVGGVAGQLQLQQVAGDIPLENLQTIKHHFLRQALQLLYQYADDVPNVAED